MEEVEKAKKKRRTLRGTTTKLLSKIESLLSAKDEDQDRIKLKQCLKDLTEKHNKLKDLDEGILNSMIEQDDNDEACESEADEVSEINAKINYIMISTEEAIARLQFSEERGVSGVATAVASKLSRHDSKESVISDTSEAGNPISSHRKVKLPKLELKKFGGKISEWQEFWDAYKSAIHDDTSLAKVDKFKYLRGYLEEPAKSVVTGFSLTDADYDAAVELLIKRFAKPGVIKRAHINELLSLAPVFKETSLDRLRMLRDQIETHFRALEAQSVDKVSYSSVVVPVLMEKVPQTLRHNMIRFGKNHMDWNVDDLLEALEKELDVLEGHVPILKSHQQQQQQPRNPEYQKANNRPKTGPSTASALFSGRDVKKCPYCLEEHSPEDCQKVKETVERKKVLFRYARCFVCLNSGHRAYQCRSKTPCKICKGKHHVSICSSAQQDKDKLVQAQAQSVSATAPLDPNARSWVGNTGSGMSIALQTALASVNENDECKVRVLFDTGSHKSFITARAVTRLGLEPERRERLGIKAFGKKEAEVKLRDIVCLSLGSSGGERNVRIEAFIVDDIANISNVHVEVVKHKFSHLRNVFFSDVSRYEDNLEIDCLIGSDYFWAFQDGEVIRGGSAEPVAVKTAIGWVLSGPIRGKTLNNSSECAVSCIVDTSFVLVNHEQQELNSNLNKLWDLDSIGIRTGDDVYSNVIDDIQFTGERYSVGLPWKVAHKPLPSNYSASLARLKNLITKLQQTPEIFEKYNEVILQQIRDGMVEQVSELEPENKVHYLPHRAVIREDAETTKLRVVYDASCKDKKTGVSLNDCLHVGPSLTPMIFDVLLRFRATPVALVGDIEKAFLNIEIHPGDRDCLRFLWVKDIHAADPEIIVLRFQRVVFGCNSSPFLLNAVLRLHISKYLEQDPEFASKLRGGFFVDDLVTGGDNPDQVFDLFQKVKDRMQDGGFSMRKWKTNDQELAKKIAEIESAREQKVMNDSTLNETFAKATLGTAISHIKEKGKVLGLTWDYNKDTLEFDLGKVGKFVGSDVEPTKRGILSTLASLFDPQGVISPIGVSAKILFQELCVDKVGWDDPLPEDKRLRWEAWLKELNDIKNLTIPRCMFEKSAGEVLSCSLHGFADASKKAYCAMIYLVYKTANGYYTRLLCAKTRVAPLKELSIPRLELISARVLATLMDTTLKALSSEVKVDSVRYWSDSKTTLYWIANNGEWRQFVQHRVNEILTLSQKEEWGHVPGTQNPADLGSRGVSAYHLRDSKLWWEGPEWLRQEDEKWPRSFELESSSDVTAERKKTAVLVAINEVVRGVGNVIDINRFSRLGRLLRVTAYVQRFIRNMKNRLQKAELKVGNVSPEEIESAEKMWILDSQAKLQKSYSFQKLAVQLGVIKENEMLVCKGRLGNAELEFRSRFPILLPRDDKFAELVVIECHEKVHHCKERATLAEVRSKFWITKGRQYVKKIINNCFICKKFEGKSYNPPVAANLPDFRVTEALPFSKMGVDFAGPIYTKGSSGEMNKCYIALFTCCITRAVHLELVENLSASTFVNCLRRVCSRRGTPSLMVSDNAKTFKATAKLLQKLVNDSTVIDYLNSKRISWRFNIERAPWMGGIFERMVGTVKRCLRKVLGNAKLSFDELYTVLTEIESTVNSRPLTYQYNEVEEALTPSHLIFGHRLSVLSENVDLKPDGDKMNVDKLCKRFIYLSRKLQHFWNRWRREYLTDLREQHRLKSSKPPTIREGDVVLIHDDNTKRGEWKMGIIEALITGKDGHVRGAQVRKVGHGKFEILTRPLQKLFPLEINDRESEEMAGELPGEMEGEVSGKMKGEESENFESESEEKEERTGVSMDTEGRVEGSKENRGCEERNRTLRAAAKNARLLSRLMLDP